VHALVDRREEATHALHAVVVEEAAEHAAERQAVLERVAGARRSGRAIRVDLELAPRVTAHVTGVEVKRMPPARLPAGAGASEVRVTEHQLRRHHPLGKQAARPVEIREHRAQHLGALAQPARQPLPAIPRDDERDRIQTPAAGASVRSAEDVEGDLVRGDALAQRGAQTIDLTLGGALQEIVQTTLMRTRHPSVEPFVVGV
jgi:hypothetical protein